VCAAAAADARAQVAVHGRERSERRSARALDEVLIGRLRSQGNA
jgi:hypothetical protein